MNAPIVYKVVPDGDWAYVTAEGWEHLRVPVRWNDADGKQKLIESAKYAFFMKLKSIRERETIHQ